MDSGPRRSFAWFGHAKKQDAAGDPLLAFSSEDDQVEQPTHTVADTPRKKAWVATGVVTAILALVVFAIWPLRVLTNRSAAAEFGNLSITTRPAGATVVIDGIARGATPLTMPLSPGAHTMVLRQGTDERTVPLTVTAGEQASQYFELAASAVPAPLTGKLNVATDGGATRVVVDGHPSGTSPIVLAGLSVGDHTVAIATDAGMVERHVKIEAGATTSVVFSTPQVGSAAGWVAVAAPFEVQIYQDKELVGSSAASRIMMTAGRHDVRLTNAALGYEETRRIDVAAGKTNAIRIAPPTVPVSINAKPWADVFVDGTALGQTPLANVSFPIGTRQIVFRHPQLGERRQTMVVTVAGPNRVSVDFTKQ
jgi:hypothetical protein